MESAETLRKSLPVGTRLVLVDELPGEEGMPAGLMGTVEGVDDACNIHMKWDNGRTLSLVVDDNYRVVSPDEDIQLLSAEALNWLKTSGYSSANHERRMELIKIARASFDDKI